VCTIESVRYVGGSTNPANACQSCQPSRSKTAWSNLASGPGCLSASSTHSCALVKDDVWCWGGSSGVLGDGTRDSSSSAVAVQGLASGVQSVAVSTDRSAAVANGGVYFWGTLYAGNGSMSGSLTAVPVYGLDQGFAAVTSGEFYSCALGKGEVWCWGSNAWGIFGSSVAGCERPNPTLVNCLVPVKVAGLPSDVRAIAGGTDHMCALADDDVWCWGRNSYHQVSPDDESVTPFVATPRKIAGLPSGLQTVVAGMDRTCVLAAGNVLCWGFTDYGDSEAVKVPTMVPGLPSDIRGLAVGRSHTCALLDDGVICWGPHYWSPPSNGPGMGGNPGQPVRVQGLPSDIRAIAAGDENSCAMGADGIWCWGERYTGLLISWEPRRIPGIPGF
jgi:alpha-tubulin suppressor-like RCC1 family protein